MRITKRNWVPPIVCVPLILGFASGCSTSRRSVLLGSTFGASLGTGMGLAAGGAKGAAVGGPVGALTGGILGYLAHREEEKKKASQSAQSPRSLNVPALNRPEVRTLWVPERIENDRFIEGHRIFIIDKQSTWSR